MSDIMAIVRENLNGKKPLLIMSLETWYKHPTYAEVIMK